VYRHKHHARPFISIQIESVFRFFLLDQADSNGLAVGLGVGISALVVLLVLLIICKRRPDVSVGFTVLFPLELI
jgi:hypothetical protein